MKHKSYFKLKIKYILPVLFTLFLFECTENKGKREVPEAVKKAFLNIKPDVKKVQWGFEYGNFEAEFTENQIETSLLFDEDGKLLETEVAIADSLLPPSAQTYIKEHYSGKKITEMARITDFTNKVIYEVEINGFDVLFDSSGSFITSIKN